MRHLNVIRESRIAASEFFLQRAAGKYYTSELVGKRLAEKITANFVDQTKLGVRVKVVDPFGGDGRLIIWLLEAWKEIAKENIGWDVEIWDQSASGFLKAKEGFELLVKRGVDVRCSFKKIDSFYYAAGKEKKYDIVLTNPPWEVLKPDRRELDSIPEGVKKRYIAEMKSYDDWLATQYPLSQPKRKFAGWGTNLSRVGLELSLRLVKESGCVGIVLPATSLADEQTSNLRENLFENYSVKDIAYYPAEAKQYNKADVSSITLVVDGARCSRKFQLYTHEGGKESKIETIEVDDSFFKKNGYVFPVSFGGGATRLLGNISQKMGVLRDYEMEENGLLWAGREADETGIKKFLSEHNDGPLFIKGKMIERFGLKEFPCHKIERSKKSDYHSCAHRRIVWRDVSRPNQKRRMIATIIPKGWVVGNSLGVMYFKKESETALNCLLGILNSTVFEFQLRAYLASGHVSLSTMRKVAVPAVSKFWNDFYFSNKIASLLDGARDEYFYVDAYVAKKYYCLEESEYAEILRLFRKLNKEECSFYLKSYKSISPEGL